MSELTAHEVPLHKIFSGDYAFSIPPYQRPYAWQVEQAIELLNDLREARERDASEPYFLGSIVLVKSKDRPAADVVDGQQRLTTLTLLLAVLRDLTEDEDLCRDLAEMIRQPKNLARGLEEKMRLSPRPKDAAFFARYVQAPNATPLLAEVKADELETDSQRAIKSNVGALRRDIEAWDESNKLAFVEFLAQRTYLVVVSTEDLESAHRIFGVMNARGLDLSPTDIFKSSIVGAIREAGADDELYSSKWEDAEEALSREGFADLFLHVRLIESKQRGRQSLLREFPEQVLSNYLPDRGKQFIDELLIPSARAYEQIRDANYSSSNGAEKVNRWFTRLAQLDNNDWRAPALWALRSRPTDPEWLDRFLQKLERLAASMFVRRVWTTPRISRYIELLRELDIEGLGIDAPAFQLTQEEQADTLRILDGDVYLTPKTRKFILLRLDETLSHGSGATYSHPVITVEHVLPQTPAADSRWLLDFTDDERATWTHRIANLVLLNQAKNSAAQNYEFQVKKRKYFMDGSGSTNFALTSQVLAHESWDPDALATRQRDLLEALARQWELG